MIWAQPLITHHYTAILLEAFVYAYRGIIPVPAPNHVALANPNDPPTSA